jgi:hypothetical protein
MLFNLAILLIFILIYPITKIVNIAVEHSLKDIVDIPGQIQFSKNEIEKLIIKFELDENFIKWSKGKKWEEIYSSCPNGDWLFSLYKKTSSSRKKTILKINGYFVKTIKHYIAGESLKDLVEYVIDYGENRISIKELARAQKKAELENGRVGIKSKWRRNVRNAENANLAALSSSTLNLKYNDTLFYLKLMDFYDMRLRKASSIYLMYVEERANICRKHLPLELWNLK